MSTTTKNSITLLYFASFREQVGNSSELFPLTLAKSAQQLVDELRARGEPFATMLSPQRKWRLAINQEVADLQATIQPGDEVALFPPVTGG
jgi:sulfur-carrier protein